MKNIGMVLDAHYPADIRVTKEANALIEAGHKVSLLCTRRNGEVKNETIDGLLVQRIDVAKNKIQQGLWDIITSILFLHPLYSKSIKSFVEVNEIDILHVHDLPLCKTAIKVGKRKNIPVICDFHENYPEALRVWFQWKKNPLIRLKNNIFFSYNRWKKYEKWVCQHATHIIAVVDEMKEKLITESGISETRISVVTNTESKGYLNQEVQAGIYSDLQKSFVIAYLGNVGPHRGVDTVIKSLSHLKDLDLIFVVVGSIKENVKSRLLALVKEYQVEQMVKFYGYQPFHTFYSYMSQADANVIPHNSNGHTDNTVPHKLFQSMMVGKPVVVSSCKPLKRLVEKTKSGVVFTANDPVSCAKHIRELYSDRTLQGELGRNGQDNTLNGKYNWEETGKELTYIYKNFGNV